MRKYLKTGMVFLLAVIFSLQAVLPVKAWNEVIACTVLGDSIAKGYSSDKVNKIKCYGKIISDQITEENEAYSDYVNYAVNGMDTLGLNENVLSKDTVKQSLNKSDIIFVTMGSNDLLNEFKNVAQDILNSDTKYRSAGQAMGELKEAVKKNPLIVLKVIDALSKWDYVTFESRWAEAMETITQQKKEGAQLIVTNIYNPIYNMNLPGTMNKVVEDIIQNMNSIIEKRADEFGYKVVDLFDSNIVAFVQGDGLHPSQEGQQIIADSVYKEITDPDSGTDSESVDGLAVKGEEGTAGAETGNGENSTQAGNEKTGTNSKTEKNKSKPDTESLDRTWDISRWTAAGCIVLVFLLILLIMYRRGKRHRE